MSKNLSRRDFLKYTGIGSAAAFAAAYGMPLGTASRTSASRRHRWPSGHLQLRRPRAAALCSATPSRVSTNAIPNVVVEDLYIPWPEGWGHYITNLKLRAASGLKTDIIAIAIEGTRETIFEDLVLPMDDAIAADEELAAIVDEVEPVLHDALKGADGQTYYFTREWNNMIIHYNHGHSSKRRGLDPPAEDWTWEDFLETCVGLDPWRRRRQAIRFRDSVSSTSV